MHARAIKKCSSVEWPTHACTCKVFAVVTHAYTCKVTAIKRGQKRVAMCKIIVVKRVCDF